jgi:hypothetical protein
MQFAMSPNLASPWREFLEELDPLLGESIELHCIGGFAVVSAYGLARSTNDLDYVTLVPFNRVSALQDLAGAGSPLARKHKVHIQHVGVATVPENYQARMQELYPAHFKNMHLFILDPYDLVLSKLSRNADRDREDIAFLAKTLNLNAKILRERYELEMKPVLIGPPERHDNTLKFWVDAYFSKEHRT